MLAYMEQSGEALARQELAADPMAPYLPPELAERIIKECRALGEGAAGEFFCVTTDVDRLLAEQGVTVTRREGAAGTPDFVLYSEYYPKNRQIVLYPGNIRRRWDSLCAGAGAGAGAAEYKELEKLFVVHELFHYLECTLLGITYEKYRVRGIGLGPLRVRSCVHAASEIGAHAFVETYQRISEVAL